MINRCNDCNYNYECISMNLNSLCPAENIKSFNFLDILRIQYERIVRNSYFNNAMDDHSNELLEEIKLFILFLKNHNLKIDQENHDLKHFKMLCKDCIISLKCQKRSTECFINSENKNPNNMLEEIKYILLFRINKNSQNPNKKELSLMRKINKIEPQIVQKPERKGIIKEFFQNS